MVPTPLETNAVSEPAQTVSDAELNAYIDGELSRERRHTIERLVACDAGVRTRIEGLLSVRELVRRAYSPTNKE
jgi:anti-sigma factor RsiW